MSDDGALTWRPEVGAFGTRTYVATLPDGRRVTIRPTGQRNGRVLGGAWRASTGWGRDAVTLASRGTLRDCKAAVERAVRDGR